VFDAETVLWEASGQYPEVREVVRRGAFARAIREKQDVAAVIEHEWGRIIARTPSTLELAEDEIGLRVVASPPATREAMDLAANIQAGNIRGMSFRFYPVETKEHTKVEERRMPDGKMRGVRVVLRELIDLDISDVSWCVWPAYDATSAGTQMRSAMLGDARRDPFAAGGALSWAGDALLRHRATSLRAAMLVDAGR
jgi:HK97 family phage prohead protease